MDWNSRRIAIAMENSALIIACAWLIVNGRWIVATVAFAVKLFDNVMLARDWTQHGAPRNSPERNL